jgi:hypothetical protein
MAFGRRRATQLRSLLHAVTETKLGDAPAGGEQLR